MKNVQKQGGRQGSERPRRRTANYLGERSISFSDMIAFLICQLRYRFYKEGAERVEDRPEQIVGDVAHKAAEKTDTETRLAALEHELSKLSDEDREQVEDDARLCVSNAEALEDDRSFDVKREKLLRVLDEETGWELVAKPDEVSMIHDDRGREVLQVIDNKTSEFLKRRDKDQIFFFGLVVYLLRRNDFFGSIKLVVKLLRAKEDPVKVFWFSRARVKENLDAVRAVIRDIEKALAKDRFKPTTGEHCHRCPFREQCRAYKAYNDGDLSNVRQLEDYRKRGKSWRLPPQYGGPQRHSA